MWLWINIFFILVYTFGTYSLSILTAGYPGEIEVHNQTKACDDPLEVMPPGKSLPCPPRSLSPLISLWDALDISCCQDNVLCTVCMLNCVRPFATPWTTSSGISQARIPEWVSISYSRVSSQASQPTCVSCKIISSVHFSLSVVSNSLQPHGPQHARPSCPSPTPRAYPNSCPVSRWCHPTISSSVVPFSSCPQSFPALGSFQMSQLSASGGQSTGVSGSTSVPSVNTQDWSPLECSIHITGTPEGKERKWGRKKYLI